MDGEIPGTVEGASTPTIPRRRTRHEVIDVDELDDEYDQRPSRRPRRPVPRGNSSRDPVSSDIIILDSDDGSEAGPSLRRRPSDARLRSPPPPVQIVHPPPPVPPLPPRPRPLRHSHVFPPDVIRPNAEPFAFERAMAPPHVTRPTSYPLPGDLPPSRHHPIINLGGGFISTNHRLEDEFIHRQHRARQRYFDHLRIARGIHQRHGFLSQTIGRIFPSWLFGDPTEEEMMDALAFSELSEPGLFGFGDDRAQFRRTTHEYRVAYTHPYPPAPGFTHNFESPAPSVGVIDVDDEPGPSTKASGSSSSSKNENFNTLVCARCSDPLVLGGSSMSEDERTRRRLWGLRCGHMLDGKCIAELMKPLPAPGLEPMGTEMAAVEPPHDRAQGQDPSTQPHDSDPNIVLTSAVPPDVKSSTLTRSKGKSRAIEQPSQLSQLTEGAGEHPTSTENNSIRSRLRPRNNFGQFSSQRPSAHLTAATPAPASNTGHLSKRRTRGKGKQKATEAVIFGRHEWRCPVALCERPHLSLNIETRGWIMDETQGAIPIFV